MLTSEWPVSIISLSAVHSISIVSRFHATAEMKYLKIYEILKIYQTCTFPNRSVEQKQLIESLSSRPYVSTNIQDGDYAFDYDYTCMLCILE